MPEPDNAVPMPDIAASEAIVLPSTAISVAGPDVPSFAQLLMECPLEDADLLPRDISGLHKVDF